MTDSAPHRLVSALDDDDEFVVDPSLRPRRMKDFIGQPKLKEHLAIVIGAAAGRGDSACDHMLFCGPPGLGKTSMAGIVASELGTGIRVTSGPALERGGDLAAILTNLESGEVLFIDEIHRLNRTVEEVLYPALEDFKIDIVIGKGPSARSIRLDLPPFALIGATTRAGMVTGPLRDRFGFIARFEYYSTEDLESIVKRSAAILGIEIDTQGAREIAARSRGTPRIANRLLKRVRDYSDVKGFDGIDQMVAREGLEVFEVDECGLDRVDRAILSSLIEKFGGGPVGLSTISVVVGEEAETVEDVYEPYLMQAGFLIRTPRGRIVTRKAYEHLGFEAPPASSTASGTDVDAVTLFDQ